MISLMKTESSNKIFISRELTKDSPFLRLRQQGHTIIAESLIDFHLLDFKVHPSYDAVFFYSQKAMSHFLDNYPHNQQIQYGVMGESSAAYFHQLSGHLPQIIGAGNMKELATTINHHWKNKKVLFPIATQSLLSLDPHLKVERACVPVYSNEPRMDIEIPSCDIYLLTSPMNARVFLTSHNFGDALVYAIGMTTATEIKQLTGNTVLYCAQPSIENLYNLVLTKI